MSGDVGAEVAAVIVRVLRENGLSDNPGEYDSNIHSWRCEYPDRYGSCDCLAELVADLTSAFAVRMEAARVDALREAASEADRDAEDCPQGCQTAWCSRANRTTADWLRDRAAALDPEATP